MKTVTLYRYKRPDGGITDTIFKPDVDYTLRFRLIADDGYILTDGENFITCIDTEEPEKWSEVEFIEEAEEATE